MKNRKNISNNDDEELALILGIMLGDGCLSRGKKAFFISISGNIKDDVNFFNKIKPIISRIRNKKTRFYFKQKQGKVEYNFSDKILFNRFVGLGFPIGKKGNGLFIPEEFCECLMRPVIQGYFATDGSIVVTNNNGTSYPRMEIKSISGIILNQVQLYLYRSGIIGKVYLNKNVPGGQDIYHFQSNGNHNLMKFRELIGFYNPKHEQKFLKYKKSAGDGI